VGLLLILPWRFVAAAAARSSSCSLAWCGPIPGGREPRSGAIVVAGSGFGGASSLSALACGRPGWMKQIFKEEEHRQRSSGKALERSDEDAIARRCSCEVRTRRSPTVFKVSHNYYVRSTLKDTSQTRQFLSTRSRLVKKVQT
jgi:hypothetical protein